MKFYRLIQSFLWVLCSLLIISNAWAETLRVDITGVQGDALKNAQERLRLLQDSYGKSLTAANIQTIYRAAPENLQKALEPFGYFSAKIEPHLNQQGQSYVATFAVNPGQPVIVTAVNTRITGEGQDDPALNKLLQHFPVKTQQIFSADNYNKAKQALFDTANNQGYLKAKLTQKEIYLDTKAHTAIITLHLETGPRYYFGEIHFQQDAFSEKFLRRFLPFHEGDPYASNQVLTFQQNLNNSHFFQMASVNPDIDNAKNFAVPMDVDLTANKSQQYNIGIGYGTFTGARLTTGVNFRHLTKTGHHMNVQIKLSSILSGLALQYVIPGSNPLTDEYTIGANAQRFIPKNGYSLSKTLSVGYVKTIHHWKHALNLNYLRENSYVNGPNNVSHNSRIFYPSYTLSHTTSDDLVNPTRGHRIELSMKGASDQFISNTKFVQTEIKAKYLFAPTEASRIILRGDFGVTVVHDLTTLPISLQFYSGGLDSVRVFPYSYEGPGRYLKVASVEYQHRIINNWHGALFYDCGTASNNFSTPLDKSVGFGVIYQSIIGPVKVYAGRTLTGTKRHYGIDFSIGPEL